VSVEGKRKVGAMVGRWLEEGRGPPRATSSGPGGPAQRPITGGMVNEEKGGDKHWCLSSVFAPGVLR